MSEYRNSEEIHKKRRERMERRKLFVKLTKVNVEIRSEDGKINIGIPYCFDTTYGGSNLKYLLVALGFDVEINKGG